MNRYVAIIVAHAPAPGAGEGGRVLHQARTDVTRRFASEHDALQFKDEVLNRFAELEVIVRPESQPTGGTRYHWDAGRIVGQAVV